MNAETIARTIQLILGPVVMINACAILISALQARYEEINSRLRAMVRERLELPGNDEQGLPHIMAPAAGDSTVQRQALIVAERIEELEGQLPELLRHHVLVRDATLAVYGSILAYVTSMFLIAAAVANDSTPLGIGALASFLVGTAIFLLGMLLITLEVRTSHRAIQNEALHALSLARNGIPRQASTAPQGAGRLQGTGYEQE